MRPVSLLLRALLPPRGPWKKDDALDALFFVRILLVLVLGIGCGVAGLQGIWTFVAAMLLNFMAGSAWLQYQRIDPEEFESAAASKTPMEQEGMGPSVSLFVLTWVTSYTLSLAQKAV